MPEARVSASRADGVAPGVMHAREAKGAPMAALVRRCDTAPQPVLRWRELEGLRDHLAPPMQRALAAFDVYTA